MREEKRWLRHGEMATAIFSFGCKTYKQPEDNSQTKHPSGPPKMTADNPRKYP